MPMPSYADAETALRGMLSGQMRWNLWLYMIKHELYTRHVIRYVEGENVGEGHVGACEALFEGRKALHLSIRHCITTRSKTTIRLRR